MEYPVVKIQSNPRHLGKMKRGHKCRMVGGSFPIALHPTNYSRVVKAFSKGKGIHVALSPDEIHHNKGRGFFDDIGSAFSDLGNAVNNTVIQPIIKNAPAVLNEVGKVALPLAKQLGNEAINAGEQYAPELAGTALAGLATMSGNPEFAPAAYSVGEQLGKKGGSALAGLARKELNNFDPYHTQSDITPVSTANSPPSRQPQTSYLNEMTGQNMGHLDRANMGSYLANVGLSQLENLVAEKRRNLGMPHFDYSGGKSLSAYADTVPASGSGLYGGMGGGQGLYGGAIHNPRKHLIATANRREIGSIGRQGNLLGHEPPALSSQALSSNFQWNNFLPPQFHTK